MRCWVSLMATVIIVYTGTVWDAIDDIWLSPQRCDYRKDNHALFVKMIYRWQNMIHLYLIKEQIYVDVSALEKSCGNHNTDKKSLFSVVPEQGVQLFSWGLATHKIFALDIFASDALSKKTWSCWRLSSICREQNTHTTI